MIRKILWSTGSLLLIAVMLIVLCDAVVSWGSKSRIYSDIELLPYNKTGLVLGTSRYLHDGKPNPYFRYRIQAAATLYHSGKISHIIVSGDNSQVSYNEPREMRRELIKLGVPAEVIHLDYAGFRTLDSVVRCREVFGQNQFTVISQKFHNERAIIIARKFNIDAVGFNAQDVDWRKGLKTRAREVLARVKVLLDLYVTQTQPKFLGEKEVI
ncbi:MAG: hypothetical protein KatS3mg031_2079 [Chitinophagales bacterium]|nr:MAG: hypothetical protein KatS3mg031_2079 [Chitinophagales bacterium]